MECHETKTKVITLANSPPPMSSDQMPRPGKTMFIKFPPSQAAGDSKCPGYARGGGGGIFKLRFDWYIKLHSVIYNIMKLLVPLKCQITTIAL